MSVGSRSTPPLRTLPRVSYSCRASSVPVYDVAYYWKVKPELFPHANTSLLISQNLLFFRAIAAMHDLPVRAIAIRTSLANTSTAPRALTSVRQTLLSLAWYSSAKAHLTLSKVSESRLDARSKLICEGEPTSRERPAGA